MRVKTIVEPVETSILVINEQLLCVVGQPQEREVEE